MLEVADAGEILLQAAAIARADIALQLFRLIGDRIENAASRVEAVNLRLDLLGCALQEKLVENVRDPLFGRDGDTAAGP
jgi:hypothetical protein